jgi:hypothetical protein
MHARFRKNAPERLSARNQIANPSKPVISFGGTRNDVTRALDRPRLWEI